MSASRVIWGVLLAMLTALALFAAQPSFAQTPAPATPPTTSATNSVCGDYPGLTNRIASCIRHSVDTAVADYFTGFYPLVSRAITAFITLVLVIYGVMAASGAVEQPAKDTVMLLLKIGAVGYFTTNVDVMHRNVVDAMDSVGTAAVRYSPGAGVAASGMDFSQADCLQTMRDAAADNGVSSNGPWLGVDCIIDTVIGIKVRDAVTAVGGGGETAHKYYNENLADDKVGLSRGFLYMFASGMRSSVMGAIFAAIGLMFLYGLVFLIGKILLIYLAAYIGIALLMIISPLFIPLVLMQRTREYFDKWVKLVINFALQPLIMLIFMVMSITAIDFAAFSGDYSVAYRIAGDASRQDGFNINTYLTTGEIITKKNTVAMELKANTDTLSRGTCNTDSTIANGLCESKCIQSIINPSSPSYDKAIAEQCAKSYDVIWRHDSLNWDKLAEKRIPKVEVEEGATPGQQIAREALAAVIFCAVVVFVMNQLVRVIPVLAVDLLGDFGQSPNLARFYGGAGRKGIGAGIGKVTGGVSDAIKATITGRGGPK